MIESFIRDNFGGISVLKEFDPHLGLIWGSRARLFIYFPFAGLDHSLFRSTSCFNLVSIFRFKMARTKNVPTKQPHVSIGKGKKASAAAPEIGGVKKAKNPRRFKPGTVAMRDIRKAQKDGNRGIPKSVIDKIVREISGNFTQKGTEMRFKNSAMRALHEAAESFNTDLFRLAGTLSLHAKHKTLDDKSLKLASTLLLCPHVFHQPQGTAQAMKGCLSNQIKHAWAPMQYPTDAESDAAHAAAHAAAAEKKAEKKAAKAAKNQAAADKASAEPAAAEPATAEPATADEGFMSADEA